MGKSIYDQFGGKDSNPVMGMLGGFQNFQQNFLNFASQIKQSGQSPEAVVRELISSGRMTQDQFNQFSNIANQLTGRNK